MSGLLHQCPLSSRLEAIEYLLEDMLVEKKAMLLRNQLAQYRKNHNLDANDQSYYGLALLDVLSSWATSQKICISTPFSVNDPLMMRILNRSTKNDNLSLRMLAFYYAYLSTRQLEEFEIWCEPVDHYYC